MNKTVNINLAGIFFHIDEDAYLKLQRYLEAIRRSFTDSQGRNEIIADIEARIAELFNERMQSEKQVVSMKEVEEVISIMGQPEDYMVDDEIFEDGPKRSHTSTSSGRKLYRDTENAYIGGVSAGLGHYFGLDPLWIRLIWVLLFFGAGTGIFIYILLWILMPAAETTSEKLAMSGKPVNITNIEEKVKEGFGNVKESLDEVTDKLKSGEYNKTGDKIKSTSRSFFDALGNVILFFFKIIAKFIGIILMIVGASTLIGLVVGLLSIGVADIFHFPGIDFADVVNSTDLPIWVVSVLVLFAVGIPFFYIFILGLKILVENIKAPNKYANFSLFGLWLAAIITLSIFAAREVTEYARDASVTNKEEIAITAVDTLHVKMKGNDMYSSYLHRDYDFDILYDENDNKLIYSSNVRLIFRSTKDSLASVSVEKNARGNSYQNAKARAGEINYNYAFSDDELILDGYFLTDATNKFRDQEVEVVLYLPEGSVIYIDNNTYSFHTNSSRYRDIIDNGDEEQYLRVVRDDVICLDCGDSSSRSFEIKDDESSFEMDSDKIEYKDSDVKATIDSSGISIKSSNN